MKYKRIFSPITLANQEIKNRIFMAPMGTGLEEQYGGGRVSTEMIDYFEARAKGGVGLIISPFAAVDERYFALTLGIYSRKLLSGISRLTEAIHVFGCKFLIQLSHFGGKSPRYFTYGNQPIAPSNIESRMYPEKPKEMTLGQIEETINLYIQSGQWAKDAGCDGVELHGAHGYLINQFISPHSNKRTDKYGGTIEKRMRFLEKIATGIRDKCGKDFIIGFKFSAHEHLDGGMDINIAKKIAMFIDDRKIVDYIHISAFSATLPGFLFCNYPSVPPIYNKHPLVPLAAEIKKVVKIPVCATGGINNPDYAENFLKKGKADIIVLGRALIADPYWVNKAKVGDIIKPCIRCNTCYKRILNQQSIKCSVNPYVGEERRYEKYRVDKTSLHKKIVILGAGPAGLEAALVATRKGHEVIVLEKSNEIGGNLRLAAVQDFKEEIKRLLSYYEKKVLEKNVKIKLGVDATSKVILHENPDVVIFGIGADAIIPNFINIKDTKILLAEEVLKDYSKLKIGEKVIIIGAGLVGCELSVYLASKGKNVILIDCIEWNEILIDEAPINRSMLLTRLKKENVKLLPGKEVIGWDKDSIILKNIQGEMEKLAIDSIIIAAGYHPRKEKIQKLRKDLLNLKPEIEFFTIGDCDKAGKLYDAINRGSQIAWGI